MSGRAVNGAPVSSVAHLTDSLESASDPEATPPKGGASRKHPVHAVAATPSPPARGRSGAAQTTANRYPSLRHAPIDTSLPSTPAQPAGLRQGAGPRRLLDQPTRVEPGEAGPADRAPPASNPSLPTVSPPRCPRVPGPPARALSGAGRSHPLCRAPRDGGEVAGFPRRARKSFPLPPSKGKEAAQTSPVPLSTRGGGVEATRTSPSAPSQPLETGGEEPRHARYSPRPPPVDGASTPRAVRQRQCTSSVYTYSPEPTEVWAKCAGTQSHYFVCTSHRTPQLSTWRDPNFTKF